MGCFLSHIYASVLVPATLTCAGFTPSSALCRQRHGAHCTVSSCHQTISSSAQTLVCPWPHKQVAPSHADSERPLTAAELGRLITRFHAVSALVPRQPLSLICTVLFIPLLFHLISAPRLAFRSHYKFIVRTGGGRRRLIEVMG